MGRRLGPVALVLGLALVPPTAAASVHTHREVLSNGLVLVVAERPAVPIVAVRVLAAAGAAFDPPDRAGLAHLTGELLTRGAGGRTGPAIDTAIEFVGGRLGAGAGRDALGVSLTVLRKDLALGLDLARDVVRAPTFPPAEFARKLAEVQAAIKRSEEDPGAVAGRALARLVYPGHPYGRPVEGTLQSVARLTRDDVVRFHRQHLRPDTTIVVVAGAVTLGEARREVRARFGDWTAPPGPPPAVPVATPPPAPGTETIRRELTQSTLMLGRQAVRQTDPDYFPLIVASYVLGGGSASRLYTRVRDEAGLAYAVGSFVGPSRYGASFGVSAQTRNAEVERVADLIRAELVRMVREPVSEAELGLAKSYLIGSFPLRLDTTAKVADFLAAVEHAGLGLDYATRYRAAVARVTAADVQRAAGRFFAPGALSRVVVGGAP